MEGASEVNWKKEIIRFTEGAAARAAKIDASFFPPLSGQVLTDWEREKVLVIPEEIRSYLLQSDGLEAQRGEIWPVLPFAKWELIEVG